MADTSVFKVPYPEPGDHTRLWEHYQALAEQIEKMAVGQYEEGSGASVNAVTGTTPEAISSLTIYGRAGIPIRADFSVWLQTIGANVVGSRAGVGFSGGGLSVNPDSAPNDFIQNSVGAGVSSIYGTYTGTRVAVPTQDGDVTVTLYGWASGSGTQNVNYPRLRVETRAWPQ